METPLDREQFPVCQHRHYLNHASVNGLAIPVAEAMTRWVRGALANGSFSGTPEKDAGRVRRHAAQLMGVAPSEVAFVKNTSEGLGFVAGGLEWHQGDRIIVPGAEFPSNVYPWTALADRGVVVDVITAQGAGEAFPAEAFARAMADGPPPRLVALSWVQFGRGWRSDLRAVAELAHAAGALVCADVIQGLGVLPAAFGDWGVDFASGGAHKWLLGPPGIGLLYVRRSVMEQLRPLEPGWASVAHREQWDNMDLVWDDSARRFESGTLNLAGIAGLGASLELLVEATPAAVWAHVDALCRHLANGLHEIGARVMSDRDGEGRSGIVTFAVPGHDPTKLVEGLRERKVIVAPRGGGVRVSPHGCNTLGDIDALLEAVGELAPR